MCAWRNWAFGIREASAGHPSAKGEPTAWPGPGGAAEQVLGFVQPAQGSLEQDKVWLLVMIDVRSAGMHFAETCCVVALGISLQGNKIPLSLVEGSTENGPLVIDLLVGLRERGLGVTELRPLARGWPRRAVHGAWWAGPERRRRRR